MKLIIIFCLVFTGFTTLTEGVVATEKLLELLRKKVESVSNDLEVFNSDLMDETTEKLNKLKTDELIKLESVKNETLKDANARIETATFEGKQVDHCLEILKTNIDSSGKSLTTAMEICVDSSLDELLIIQTNIKTHLKTRTTILEKLDQILLTCESDNSSDFQLCIAKELPSATVLVGGYYTSTLALKESVKLFIFAMPFKTSICFAKPVATFSIAMVSAQMSITECIDNA